MGKHYGMSMRRMERLLEVAKKIDPRQFDMREWFLADRVDPEAALPWSDGDVLPCKTGKLPNGHFCNTTACLAGWATTDPVLRRAGLKLKFSSQPQHDGRSLGYMKDYTLAEVFGLNFRGRDAVFHQYGHKGAKGKRRMIAEIKRVMAQPELYGSEA